MNFNRITFQTNQAYRSNQAFLKGYLPLMNIPFKIDFWDKHSQTIVTHFEMKNGRR